MTNSIVSRAVPLACCVCCLWLAGCSRFDATYGPSDGTKGQKSLNGFGAFRQSLTQTSDNSRASGEVKTRNLRRLSSRGLKHDAIVWIPTSWPPMNEPAVTQWVNRWLTQGNRTLVFVVPDSGSTETYFSEAATLAPPEQRLEYRRALARLINERMSEEPKREDVKLSDWFIAESLPHTVDLGDRQITQFEIATQVTAPEKATTPNAPAASGKIEDASTSEAAEEPNEAADTKLVIRIEAKQAGIKGKTTEITTFARVDHEGWKKSEVLVVAGGGLLTNYAMTAPTGRELAKDIRQHIRQNAQSSSAANAKPLSVAFLESDDMPISVSNAEPGAPKATGMELLTTWPLSLVTIHGLFLGVVMCLMLLPSFGRARRIRYNRVTHFGNHLNAMATLMRRSGSVVYARQKISLYLKRVRGETSGPWILPDQPTTSENQLSAATQSKAPSQPVAPIEPAVPSSQESSD